MKQKSKKRLQLLEIANKNKLLVIEDAAQAIRAYYKNKPLGGIGDLGTLSFHETKNITSGEGGALLINNESFIERAEIIREKGTNRSKFFRGQVDKYTWVDVGSSYLPGEIIAAFLYAQLEEVNLITDKRLEIWDLYHKKLKPLEEKGILRRPIIPEYCKHNAHMYYVLFKNEKIRNEVMDHLKTKEIVSVFHYIPLHSSPAGQKYGKLGTSMNVTDRISGSLLRLPLFVGMREEDVNRIVDELVTWNSQLA